MVGIFGEVNAVNQKRERAGCVCGGGGVERQHVSRI
jgi:hypothetical protein